MYSIRNVLLLVAAFLLFLGTPNPASADFSIFAQEAGVNGGTITLLASGSDFSSLSFTGVYGNFTLTGFGASASNGVNLSDLLTSATRILNNSAATQTITLFASQTAYSLPAGTP